MYRARKVDNDFIENKWFDLLLDRSLSSTRVAFHGSPSSNVHQYVNETIRKTRILTRIRLIFQVEQTALKITRWNGSTMIKWTM